MKIVTNTIPLLSPITGIGNYIFNISNQMRALSPHNDYFYYYGYYSRNLKAGSNLFCMADKMAKNINMGFITDKFKSVLANLESRKYDVYFEPNYIPLDINAKKIVTTVCDFSFLHHPEWHPNNRIKYFSNNFFKKICNSDVIVTLSKYVQEEARELLHDYNGKIVSIHLGYDQNLFNFSDIIEKNLQLPEKFILFVGSIEPRKNLKRLINAYLQLSDFIKREYRLLIVGFKGWKNEDIMKSFKMNSKYIKYLGYVSNNVLADLYKHASCLVYPSLYEGFGLPPIEAMASGCPVIVSNVASLPEVCGDAACYVNPYDVDSISEGLYNVLTKESLRKEFINKGLERVTHFSLEKAAIEHINIFEELINE